MARVPALVMELGVPPAPETVIIRRFCWLLSVISPYVYEKDDVYCFQFPS